MNRGRRAALKQRKGWKAMAEDSPADRAAGQLSRQRASLLDAALRHVPFDGWTWTALDAGARDLSLAPGEVLRLFPGGPQELLRAFSAPGDRPLPNGKAAFWDRVWHAVVNLGVGVASKTKNPHTKNK